MGQISRRALIGSAVTLAAACATRPGVAAAPRAGRQVAGIYRTRVGDFELTALYDGVWDRPIDEKFVLNAAFADVQTALTDAFLPIDKVPTTYTTLLVNTGTKLVLLDSGTGGQLGPLTGSMGPNLAAAGVDPKAVDLIVISHFHPDHINGIKTKDDELAFPNAEILVPGPEWDYFMDDGNLSAARDPIKGTFLNARRIFKNIAGEVRPYRPGADIVSGIASIEAFGHTPGHTAFVVNSGGDAMLVLGDTTHNPWLFVRHPEWQPTVDLDGPLAAQTRRKLLDRAAADKLRVQGYHFPFPASGHILRRGSGYEFVPVLWSPTL